MLNLGTVSVVFTVVLRSDLHSDLWKIYPSHCNCIFANSEKTNSIRTSPVLIRYTDRVFVKFFVSITGSD